MEKELKELREENEKLKAFIKSANYDQLFGVPFICGGVGEVDRNGLHERILICPAYGADFFEVYKKVKREK